MTLTFLLLIVLSQTPAPANVAGSEGAHPPTTSMPATYSGTATWYCSSSSACTRGYGPSDLVAAIDPSLGIPKGTRLYVRSGERSVRVRVVDVCACKGRRIIDLTSGAFRHLTPLSRGVIEVTIELAATPPALPATDTLEATRHAR